jgi:signal recognition particle subunit SRP19
MRQTDRLYIYPEYFMKNTKRSQGRRVPSKLAIEAPTCLEIKLAAQKLGYDEVEIDKEVGYPRQWYDKKGVVYIGKTDGNDLPKQKLLKELAKEIKGTIRPMLEKELEKRRQEGLHTKKSGKRTQRPVKSSQKQKKIRRR